MWKKRTQWTVHSNEHKWRCSPYDTTPLSEMNSLNQWKLPFHVFLTLHAQNKPGKFFNHLSSSASWATTTNWAIWLIFINLYTTETQEHRVWLAHYCKIFEWVAPSLYLMVYTQRNGFSQKLPKLPLITLIAICCSIVYVWGTRHHLVGIL